MTDIQTENFERTLRKHLKYLTPEADLAPDADLRSLGLDSMAAVELLFDLEDTFDLVLPDEALAEHTFATPTALRTTLETMGESDGAR